MSDNSHNAPGAHDAHDGHHDDGAVHAHVSSWKFYIAIFMALIALTLLTVGVAGIHLGKLNLGVAVVIASMKAALVVTFFMHLRHDTKFHALAFVCSLLFIGVFFAYTINDTGSRGEIDSTNGVREHPGTGEKAPGGYEEPVIVHAPAEGAVHGTAPAEHHK